MVYNNMHLSGAKGYGQAGASHTRRVFKGFNPMSGSPREDIDDNNYTLRQRGICSKNQPHQYHRTGIEIKSEAGQGYFGTYVRTGKGVGAGSEGRVPDVGGA